MSVFWIQRLDHDFLFLTLYFVYVFLFRPISDGRDSQRLVEKKSLEIEESQ